MLDYGDGLIKVNMVVDKDNKTYNCMCVRARVRARERLFMRV